MLDLVLITSILSEQQAHLSALDFAQPLDSCGRGFLAGYIGYHDGGLSMLELLRTHCGAVQSPTRDLHRKTHFGLYMALKLIESWHLS